MPPGPKRHLALVAPIWQRFWALIYPQEQDLEIFQLQHLPTFLSILFHPFPSCHSFGSQDHCLFVCLRFYVFIFRDRGKEGEKHQCVVASHVPPTRDLACNPGMCPGNRTGDPLVRRPVLNPLSHTSQDTRSLLMTKTVWAIFMKYLLQ